MTTDSMLRCRAAPCAKSGTPEVPPEPQPKALPQPPPEASLEIAPEPPPEAPPEAMEPLAEVPPSRRLSRNRW
ncbi:hypothetical protein OHB01_36330 [Microbispora hainanensis]|uniref:hypothetical protein n=1 Tax=Microbispora TaxID=2005 RepID=UPI00143B0120|nr:MULTISPECIES: hypothetical protein [Microbispora]NJP27968.1 hypothetical protein [Microbispora sp. CL1-1]